MLQLLARHDLLPRSCTPRVHRQIVRALRDRDADRAVALMADHLARLHGCFAKVVGGPGRSASVDCSC